MVAVQRGKLLAPAADEAIVRSWLDAAGVRLQRLVDFLFFHVVFVPFGIVVPPLHLDVDARVEVSVPAVLRIRGANYFWRIIVLSRHACTGGMAPDARSRGASREEWAVLY